MKVNRDVTGRRKMHSVGILLGFMLVLMFVGPSAGAQSPPAVSKPAEAKPVAESYQTLYLTNIAVPSDDTDILTTLRIMLPKVKTYLMPSQNAIPVRGTPDDIQLAQKILTDLDRPRHNYRLTYTITETEGSKRTGTQHIVLIVAAEQKTAFRQGLKAPIARSVTKVGDAEASTPGSHVQYRDVGLSIEANVESSAAGLNLRTTVEQTGIAEKKSATSAQDSVTRNFTLECSAALTFGKPLVLGSFDLPGGTRKQEIEVVGELVQ